MNKKRIITIVSVILPVTIILLGTAKLYQTYALNSYTNTDDNNFTFNVSAITNTSVNVPADGYRDIFYMVVNTSPGTVRYGVSYTVEPSVTVKEFDTSNDPASGLIEENGKKYVKLRLENTSSAEKNITLSTILGYENGGDLIIPSGTLLVTDTYKSVKTIADYITRLYTEATKTPIANNEITYNFATSVSLMNDRLGGTSTDLDGGNIRYYGENPNNYIYFNCSDYSNQSSSTCEIWRIIGVFGDKVKIIRNESIGNLSWDYDKNDDSSKTSYDNDWSTATLQKLLNTSYYNGAGVVTYYIDDNSEITLDMNTIGLKNDDTRNMIASTSWNLGGWNTSSIFSDQIYGNERGTKVYSSSWPTSWSGKIALMYPSDYGYAADFNLCKQGLNNYSDSTCNANNWLYINKDQWLLTTFSQYPNYALGVVQSGEVRSNGDVRSAFVARPVLYLDSELGIKTGDGTSASPYKLSM